MTEEKDKEVCGRRFVIWQKGCCRPTRTKAECTLNMYRRRQTAGSQAGVQSI